MDRAITLASAFSASDAVLLPSRASTPGFARLRGSMRVWTSTRTMSPMPNPTPPFGWTDDKPDAELHTLQFGNGEYGSSCFSMSDGPDPSTWADVDDSADPSVPDD